MLNYLIKNAYIRNHLTLTGDSYMRKKTLLIATGIIILIVVVIYSWVSRPFNEVFYVPEGFKGCANIVYNIEGTPALEVEKHAIQYRFGKDGILLTSSPYDFGWEGQKTSGFSKTEYYYVNKNGDISEIPNENIGEGTLGEYSKNGRLRLTRYAVPIGSERLSCESNHEELDKLVDEKLN